jgi:hypothetical protein
MEGYPPQTIWLTLAATLFLRNSLGFAGNRRNRERPDVRRTEGRRRVICAQFDWLRACAHIRAYRDRWLNLVPAGPLGLRELRSDEAAGVLHLRTQQLHGR